MMQKLLLSQVSLPDVPGMPWLGGLLYRGDGIRQVELAHCPMISWLNNGGGVGLGRGRMAMRAPTLYGS